MAVEDSVAQDQLRAFITRIERMEGEKAEIAADIKSIYAEARGNGFDTKILRKIVAIRKQDANERMEQEAILELYMGALGMVAAPTADYDDEPVRNTGPMANSAARLDAWAEHVADRIDPQLLLTIIEASKTEAGRKLVMNAIEAVKAGDVVSTAHIENTEPQPTKAAGSDLAIPPALNGQVATHSQAKASEYGGANVTGESAPDDSVTGDAIRASDGAGTVAPIQPDKSVEAPASAASATDYPLPGEVYWENTPRRPVRQHEYSKAFGTLGQDIHVITEDISKAQSAAIVMIGDTILDGWARFMVARGMVGIDGQTTDYPAYQYDDTDPLMDCIRLNVAGRILNDSQRQIIAKRLIALDPKRKADIVKAFGFIAEVAA